ncbi:MAG: FAD-dependent thymidylate synthase [Clostridia bacterium]
MRVQPNVVLIEHTPNPDKLIALSAKLCYSDADILDLKNVVEEKEQDKFISKLMSMSHLSPIEHASFTFGIEGVSRSLLAQITRHRVASFSVKSQRYVGANEDFNYILPPSIEALGSEAAAEFDEQMKTIGKWYKEWQVRLGGNGESANEDARFVLPNASETKMLVTMNARELLHFFELRCCNRAQWEIREIAWQMLGICKAIAPSIFKNAGPSCLQGRCGEGAKTCGKSAEVKQRADNLVK